MTGPIRMPNRRGFLALTGATLAGSALASCTSGGSTNDAIAGNDATGRVVEHLWARDGVDGFTNVTITGSKAGPADSDRMSAQNDRGRIAARPGETQGNNRACWVHDGTDWADSEVTSLWYPPSVIDKAVCMPQMGHVHRVSEKDGIGSGIVVSQNIYGFGFWTTFLAAWTWGKGTYEIEPHASLTGSHWAYPYVRMVRRIETDAGLMRIFLVDRTCGIRAGDLVDVAGCEDATFNGTGLRVFAVAEGPNPTLEAVGPTIYVVDDGKHVVQAAKTQAGYLELSRPRRSAINPRRIYPMWVTSRLVGTTLMLKKWYYDDLEPIWGNDQRTIAFDLAVGNNRDLPTGGACGILSNHLRNDAWMEYGDVTFLQL